MTESPGANVGPGAGASLRSVPGVKSVEPLQHRFAYVGADLQDLYGVRPRTIGAAASSRTPGSPAAPPPGSCTRSPRGPTRCWSPPKRCTTSSCAGRPPAPAPAGHATKRLRTIPFHYAGVAKEFPTAPTDSFLVANADYVARSTGNASVGTFLIQTDGTDPGVVARRVRARAGAAAQVTDIVNQRKVVGSNLTAVELSGLTKVELGFALVLAMAASGLALGLGFRERRRTFAIASALGARSRQLGGFVWGESLFVTAGGPPARRDRGRGDLPHAREGAHRVFDPPPDALAVPWTYLVAVGGLTIGAVVAARRDNPASAAPARDRGAARPLGRRQPPP